jgi:hypothetical protein
MLSYSSLALGSAQFYRVSAARLGPGAFMLSMPKLVAGSLAPLLAITGAAGAGLAMAALWLDRGRLSGPRRRARLAAVAAGATGATLNAVQTRRVTASRGNFADAFGADWEEQIPSQLKGGMLARRWTWDLRVAPGAHVERDVAFATVPGTDRRLLADVWSPPDGVAQSTIGFIYLHGGGYSAFDKGGPTELFFPRVSPPAQGAMYDVDRFLALMAAPVDWKATVTRRRVTHAGE